MMGSYYRQALINKMGDSVTQSKILADSIETAYLSSGSGYPLICLHGAGAGSVTWYPSMGPFSQHFHVIAPDIVGYGESQKPDATYTKAYFSKWLKEFISALAITKAHILGLSQGGAIALQFVMDNPTMVDKLVLVDAGGLGAQPSFAAFFGMLWLNTYPSSLANRYYSRYLLFDTDHRDPNHAHYSVEVLKKNGGRKAFTQGKGAAVSKIPEALLQQITHETLIVWGEDDQLFPIEYGKAAAETLPHATFYSIAKAGHLPLMDQPDDFNNAIIDFLNREARGAHQPI